MSKKSLVFLQSGEWMWMIKSPRSKLDGETEDSCVMNSERSERKEEGWGLGGR